MKPNWSIISIISRFVAVAIGLVQSIIIIKYLTVGEWGLVKIVTSVVAMAGVFQNLGISSGATREIAATKDNSEASKVFFGALSVRYLISIPIALYFIFGANYLGEFYGHSDIIKPFRIFGIIVLLQTLQSTLKSFIQGKERFRFLFSSQIFEALLSLFLHIYFLSKFGFIGVFYALLGFNLISVLVLALYVGYFVRSDFRIPSMGEFLIIIKSVFKIGIAVYIIKIIVTQWQNLGPAYLGKILSEDEVAIFSFALLIASKISTISDAITDVTLPSMTKVYETSREKFEKIFKEANSKSFVLILYASVMLVLLKYEGINFIDFVFTFIGKDLLVEKYHSSFRLMDPLILGFWGYSHYNLIKSGLAVPMIKLKEAVAAAILLLLVNWVLLYILPFDQLLRYAIAMGIAGLFAYIGILLFQYKSSGILAVTYMDAKYVIWALFTLGFYYSGVINNVFLAIVFTAFTLGIYRKLQDEKAS